MTTDKILDVWSILL